MENNMENISKQIIVMRKSFLVDGKKVTPRKGKYIAQGAHASLKAILDIMNADSHSNFKYIASNGKDGETTKILKLAANTALHDWITGSFTKICCSVETEEELLTVYNKAKEKGLICSLITDKGLTEFGGVATITCCAIGPAWNSEIDPITSHLPLF